MNLYTATPWLPSPPTPAPTVQEQILLVKGRSSSGPRRARRREDLGPRARSGASIACPSRRPRHPPTMYQAGAARNSEPTVGGRRRSVRSASCRLARSRVHSTYPRRACPLNDRSCSAAMDSATASSGLRSATILRRDCHVQTTVHLPELSPVSPDELEPLTFVLSRLVPVHPFSSARSDLPEPGPVTVTTTSTVTVSTRSPPTRTAICGAVVGGPPCQTGLSGFAAATHSPSTSSHRCPRGLDPRGIRLLSTGILGSMTTRSRGRYSMTPAVGLAPSRPPAPRAGPGHELRRPSTGACRCSAGG